MSLPGKLSLPGKHKIITVQPVEEPTRIITVEPMEPREPAPEPAREPEPEKVPA